MSLLNIILAVLGIAGIGYGLFKTVKRPSIGAHREQQIDVEAQKKLDSIADDTAKKKAEIAQGRKDSQTKSPSDAIRDLIRSGKVSP